MIFAVTLSILFGYLLGSIPFPYLLGKLRGVDLFAIGTGNPGAANLFRKVSKRLGILASVFDIAKGAAAVLLASSLGVPRELTLLAGTAAMVGHWHSLFLRFRGGEALATVVGVGIGVAPLAGVIGIMTGLLILGAIRSTGHAAALAWPVFLLATYLSHVPWQVGAGLTALMVAVTLRSNVRSRRRRPV